MTNRAKVAHARAPHCSPIQSLLLAGILIALVPRIVTSLLSRLRIVIARFSLLAGRLGVHRAGRYQAEAGAPRRATPRLVRAQEAVRRRHSPVRTLRCPSPPAARRRGSQRQSGAIAVPTTAAPSAPQPPQPRAAALASPCLRSPWRSRSRVVGVGARGSAAALRAAGLWVTPERVKA